MVNYLKLARKIMAANAPPSWLREREEWAALQAIVGGWLETTSVIAVPDSASGFALVDNETGERREHEPGVDVAQARAVANAPATARQLVDELMPALRVAVFRLAEAERSAVSAKISARLAEKLRGLGLIQPDAVALTPLGREVHALMDASRP